MPSAWVAFGFSDVGISDSSRTWRTGSPVSFSLGNTLHGTILVQGPFSLSRFHVDTIYVLRKLWNLDLATPFGDAISNHGLHFGFGHLGHMDVSLGCGFSWCRERQLPYSWYGWECHDASAEACQNKKWLFASPVGPQLWRCHIQMKRSNLNYGNCRRDLGMIPEKTYSTWWYVAKINPESHLLFGHKFLDLGYVQDSSTVHFLCEHDCDQLQSQYFVGSCIE